MANATKSYERMDWLWLLLLAPNTELAAADARLQDFLREFYPLLPSYLPGAPGGVGE